LLKARTNITTAAIYKANGSVFATYTRGNAAVVPAAPQAEGVRVEDGRLVVFRRVENAGEYLGTVYLRAHYERTRRLKHYLAVLALVAAVSLALAFLLSNGLITVVTRPILAVSDVARRITGGADYSLRANRTTDDEIGQVVDAFNGMLDELGRQAQTLERAHQDTLRLNAELEDRVRSRTAQLENANQELEAFSYSASHDLRSPLRVIDSFSSLLERSVRAHLDDRGRHYLDRIRFNVRLMGDLIDALLALAHVSRVKLHRESVDLGAMARNELDQCRERDPDRVVQVSIGENMMAQADAALINQVVQNLVANAWKFTSKMPSASITVGCENLPGQPSTFFVRDNGAGFDMAYADKLFSAFQRLHGPAEFPGSGIGLATVQRIVARHEGRIWAQGAVDEGATFFFTLGR
jgi:signal transduction histidine kinase